VPAFVGFIRRHCRRPTLVEALVLIAIVAILVALIVPGTHWAASGSIRLPVRVVVFDAARGEPISDAHVAIFYAPPLLDLKSLETERDLYDSKTRVRDGNSSTTDANGTAVIEYEFRTGANHERPEMHAHVRWAWVHVHAGGYGGVVVPVRNESLPTKTLRDQKELLVPVGLMREN
jgi:hypothetical protein